MRIISLKAENIKKLKVLDLTPNEFINRISGANGSGKTSALDAIEWALTGTSNVASQPVRKGAGKAVIQLDLGDIVVTRRFFEGGNKNGVLALESKENKSRYQSPQQLLDNLMGKISFDPLEFLRMPAKKQFEVLQGLVQVSVNLGDLKAAYDRDYLRRREAKKERDNEEVRRNAIAVPDKLPKEKIDEAALVKELQEASSYNEDIARQQRERDDLRRQITQVEDALKERDERIKKLNDEIFRLTEANVADAKKALELETEAATLLPLPEPKDAAQLAAQITEARTINHGIDRRRLRDSYTEAIERLDAEIEQLSAALKESEETKTKAIEAAEFPVPGLAFGDDEVIYRGFPFEQVSNADQIRASVAIGMATNPELRVMRIKDGSLLDDKSLKIIAEMAHAHDFQVFIEQVSSTGKVGVFLEEGEVKAINEEPLDKTPGPVVKRARAAKKISATA
jgi:AAA domain